MKIILNSYEWKDESNFYSSDLSVTNFLSIMVLEKKCLFILSFIQRLGTFFHCP